MRRSDARPYLLRDAELFTSMGLDDYAERQHQAVETTEEGVCAGTPME